MHIDNVQKRQIYVILTIINKSPFLIISYFDGDLFQKVSRNKALKYFFEKVIN
jgi:hypothetical protein